MWTVYIIYSGKLDRYYTGYTEDIQKRLTRHNDGWGNYTSKANDWVLVYSEIYTTKSDALKRERDIKSRKSRKYIEDLIHK